MYKVYCDGALIYDPRDDEFTLLNPKVDIEVNKAGSMDFTILPGHSSYDKINKLKSHISVKQDGKEIWAGRPTDVVTDFMNRKKVHCEGELAYLNDSVQRPKEYKGVSVIGYLNHLMDNHNAQVDDDKKFKVGVVTVRDQNDYLLRYTNWETTLKAISEDLVDSLGGYIFIRNENGVRYIDYLADFMHTNTQKIEFGENMLNFSKNFDTTDVATCVIPLGARLENSKIEALGERVTIESVNGGVDSIVSQEAVKLYGKISKTVVYDDVKIPSNLLKKGTDYLKAAQWERMTLEAKALDLHFVDGSFEQFKVGEYVRVVSKPHGMDANFPLVKMSIKLDKVSDNTVTLGIKKNLSLSASTIEASSEIKKQLEMVPKRYDVIKLAKENATNIISKVMGGFVVKTENELLVMDTDDIKTAKNVWRWNVNGLGFSRNGYDGPYETAMTMDGAFVADMITTGILKGGNVHFNLNDGTFLIGENENNYFLKFDGNRLKFGTGSLTSESLDSTLKSELKGRDGEQGKAGEPGKKGVGIREIKRYYMTTSSSSTPYLSSSNWSTSTQTPSKDYPYLWSYTKTIFDDGNTSTSSVEMIGHFGRDGINGEPGKDGSLAELPESLKQWANNATEISGSYVYTPEIFIGETSPATSYKTGLYVGKRLTDRGGSTMRGLTMMRDGYINAYFGYDGYGYIGRNPDRRLIIYPDGTIDVPKVRAGDIETGAITTDMLYPGDSQRIILERGYSPGSNNAMSIDANGDAIRLKYSSGSYVRVDDSGVSCYRYGTQQLFAGGGYNGISVNSGTVMELGYRENSINIRHGDGFFVNYGNGNTVLQADNGGVQSKWGYLGSSDVKLKENICKVDCEEVLRKNEEVTFTDLTSDDAYSFLKDTSLFNYNYKSDTSPRFSLITQLVKGRARDFLIKYNKHFKSQSVELYNYISILHAGIQVEIKRNDELEAKVKSLEAEVEELKKLIKGA
ncbi:phage tail spike protein [Peptostreptococcus anaerobius]|uniref:phage tail spike protein n=1 Tax=Peptostreptococcus anaerobius TaxID=1261 RepID=UPI0034A283B1